MVGEVDFAAEGGVGGALGGGEEERALALPVGGVDVAGDDGLVVLWGTTGGVLVHVL